jgi:fluoroquinolone transport system permease protein
MLMPVRRLRRQLRLVPALLVPTARAVGWVPALAAFVLSLGLLALAVRRGLDTPPAELVRWVRLAIIVAALGYAFLLDDPSEPTTEGVAGSLLLRRSLRVVALLLPATAAWWVGVVWRVQAVHPGLPLPVAALTLEAAALLAVTVALAAAGSRLAPERRGGVVAAPALLALTSAAFLLPAQVTLYAQPGSAAWDGAHRRWALLLGLALAAFALASRDPAHRRLPSWLRGLADWRTRPRTRTRGRAARAGAGRSGSPDAAGRVERSVG